MPDSIASWIPRSTDEMYSRGTAAADDLVQNS
jgi:hypothetical protein